MLLERKKLNNFSRQVNMTTQRIPLAEQEVRSVLYQYGDAIESELYGIAQAKASGNDTAEAAESALATIASALNCSNYTHDAQALNEFLNSDAFDQRYGSIGIIMTNPGLSAAATEAKAVLQPVINGMIEHSQSPNATSLTCETPQFRP